jgi:hypothetical protein
MQVGKPFELYRELACRCEHQDFRLGPIYQLSLVQNKRTIHSVLTPPQNDDYVMDFLPSPGQTLYVHFFSEKHEYKIRILEFKNFIGENFIALTEIFQYGEAKLGKVEMCYNLNCFFEIGRSAKIFELDRQNFHSLNNICAFSW